MCAVLLDSTLLETTLEAPPWLLLRDSKRPPPLAAGATGARRGKSSAVLAFSSGTRPRPLLLSAAAVAAEGEGSTGIAEE